MNLRKNRIAHASSLNDSVLHQGDCVHLVDDKNLFQIIGIDNEHEKCWVRQWPLLPKGSPVFEISIQQIALP
ncbi:MULTISPECIES: hypothetical protein [Prochlorococcus]|uniref:hypothetical protein n=1 Tax=Prochlorococcus TaxID=1218 RepID=UPI000533B0C4|nr:MULTISPECIES: hypothetical protein [Prochlorococcus]KGG12209.1 hypothetical protein EV05_1415 [Prochlorococcus sp. MIT 0601]